MSDRVHDFAAIGLGPFNLGLACLTQPIAGLDGIFLDENEAFDWHSGLLLQDATLQTPFLADLVTLADPTSPFSFLNYLKHTGRIYSFYIRENFFVLRAEYNRYCRWVAEQLPSIEFDTRVEHIEHDATRGCYLIHSRSPKSGRGKCHRARRLVLGTGPSPWVPACCEGLAGPAIHASDYLTHKARLQQQRSITVVGSGQSAAEIYYDLLQDIDRLGYALHWITRSPRFFPLEYSKLTLEMTSPEYVDYFHALPEGKRERLSHAHKPLYKGINESLINAIFELLYQKDLVADIQVGLHPNVELKAVGTAPGRRGFNLRLYQREQGRIFEHRTDGLILATGYAYRTPSYVRGVASRIRWDPRGRFAVGRNYSVDRTGSEIFVQNAELHTHGFSAPDLGMACYRNAYLIREMTGVEHYPLERRIAFQRFSAPENALARAEPDEPGHAAM